jgi:hypothetical protein
MEYLNTAKGYFSNLVASAKKAVTGENGATAEVHGYTPAPAPAPAPAAPAAPLTAGARRKTRRGGRKHKGSRRHARK